MTLQLFPAGADPTTAPPLADASAGTAALGTIPAGDIASVLQNLISVLQQLVAALSSMTGSSALSAAPATAATGGGAAPTAPPAPTTLPADPMAGMAM